MNSAQITKKDLLLLSRDRRTLFVLVALPLAFIAIIGSSTGQLFSQAENARKYKLGVVDADKSNLSTSLIDELHELKALEVEKFEDRKSGKAALAEDRIHVLLQIGPKYHELVEELEVYDILHSKEGRLQGTAKSLDVTVEAGSFLANASELLEKVVFSFALQTIGTTVIKKDPKLEAQIKKSVLRSKPKHDEDQLANLPPPPESQAPSMNTIVYQTVVPGYTVMFVFFIVNFMARSFIAERDLETLKRLRVAPIPRLALLLGKTVPFLVISLVQTVLLFLAGKAFFGMSWGPEPWMLAPVMLATSLAATSLGLVVATAVRTDTQVSAYGNFLVLILAGISGCLMPRSWQPELMQKIGLATPHAWALIAYDQILNRDEPDLMLVWKCLGAIMAFAAAFFTTGWARYRSLAEKGDAAL